MIAGLKPYPVMKDSGVEQLGKVPEHWNVRELGRIGAFFKGNGGTKEDEVADGVPCVRYGDLYTRHRYYIENAKSCVSEERAAAYTPIWFGDVLFAGSGETIEEIGKSAVNLLDEPACCGGDVIVFRPSIDLEPRFLGLATDCPQAAYQKSCVGRGITVMHIYGSELKYLSIALPPAAEQAAIVRYLDHVDRRVRRLLRAKRKLIALLTEQKQAIIHCVVTRGLDPDVPLKDSGVEWLGEVPRHWDVMALRRRWSVTDCKHLTVPFVEEEGSIPLASVREVQPFELSLATAKRTTYENYASLIEGGRKPVVGDLIYCRNVSVGAAAIITTKERFAMGQDVCLIRSAKENQRFLNYFLHSPAMERQLSLLLVGSTFNRINVADIKGLLVAVPPRSEQDEIVAFLDGALVEIEEARGIAKKEIELLTEYRTRLTADVVTGKLDVREAAAALPEVDALAQDDKPDTPEFETDLDELEGVPEEAES